MLLDSSETEVRETDSLSLFLEFEFLESEGPSPVLGFEAGDHSGPRSLRYQGYRERRFSSDPEWGKEPVMPANVFMIAQSAVGRTIGMKRMTLPGFPDVGGCLDDAVGSPHQTWPKYL